MTVVLLQAELALGTSGRRRLYALDSLLLLGCVVATSTELELQSSRWTTRRHVSSVALDQQRLEFEDGLDTRRLRPGWQVGQANIIEVVHAMLRESEPGLLRVDAKGEKNVFGNVVEADRRLDLLPSCIVECEGRIEGVLVEPLDGNLGDVERRIEVQADVGRVELREGLDDRAPPLRELSRRVDHDGDLEECACLACADDGAVIRRQSEIVAPSLDWSVAEDASGGVGEVGSADNRCSNVIDVRPLEPVGRTLASEPEGS